VIVAYGGLARAERRAEDDVCPMPADFLAGISNSQLRQLASDSEQVFANPLTGVRIIDPRRPIINVVEKRGVSFSSHDLRRTFASIVSRLGDRLSYYTTKRLLNHRTSDVTQGYIQFDLEQLRSAMQAVEDFVLENVTA
jgi:integrase